MKSLLQWAMEIASQEAEAMRRPRCNHTAAFKAKAAIAALKGDETLAALAEKFDIHPNQITQWKPRISASNWLRARRYGAPPRSKLKPTLV